MSATSERPKRLRSRSRSFRQKRICFKAKSPFSKLNKGVPSADSAKRNGGYRKDPHGSRGNVNYHNRNQHPSRPQYHHQQHKPQTQSPPIREHDSPISKDQMKEVIKAAEILEHQMKQEYMNNVTNKQETGTEQNAKDTFHPEQPILEDAEYTVDNSKVPSNFMLPPNQKPLTLQSVMRPQGPYKPNGGMRPPFRRPAPPEIKVKRPTYQKNPSGYPLPMPGSSSGPMSNTPMGSINGPLGMSSSSMNGPHGIPDLMGSSHGAHSRPMNNHHGPSPGPMHNHHGPSAGPMNNYHGPSSGPMVNHHNSLSTGPINNYHGPPPGTMRKPYGKPPNGYSLPPQPHLHKLPPLPSLPPKGLPAAASSVYPVYNQPPQKQMSQKPTAQPQTPNMNLPNEYNPQGQTMSLGKSDLIANQIVKSQITLPGMSDSIAQFGTQQSYLNIPGQIILGKPMENPIPLDQQMIPTKQNNVVRVPPSPKPEESTESTLRLKSDSELHQSHVNLQHSDFMIKKPTEYSTIVPAVNTGFKPDSIVVESGFKPIIREPLMATEDRITDFDDNTNESPNRRGGTNVDDDEYVDSQQSLNQPFYSSDQLTQSFEPMFIPSPEDHMMPSEITKEVFPSNHAKEDRPHPVYVKSELNALFSKVNVNKQVPFDFLSEGNRISQTYLPPDPKQNLKKEDQLPENTFSSFDGKIISGDTLTKVDDKKSKDKTDEILKLLNTPQTGPFKGDLSDEIKKEISGNPTVDAPINTPDKRSDLKLVNDPKDVEQDNDDDDILNGEESKKKMYKKNTRMKSMKMERQRQKNQTKEKGERQKTRSSKRVILNRQLHTKKV